MFEVGAFYRIEPSATYPKERVGRFVRERGDLFVEVAWPNRGHTSLIVGRLLKGPVDPPESAATCVLCGNTREVTKWGSVPGEPWRRIKVGTQPCPSCS